MQMYTVPTKNTLTHNCESCRCYAVLQMRIHTFCVLIKYGTSLFELLFTFHFAWVCVSLVYKKNRFLGLNWILNNTIWADASSHTRYSLIEKENSKDRSDDLLLLLRDSNKDACTQMTMSCFFDFHFWVKHWGKRTMKL